MKKIGFIGAGNMAEAIFSGAIDKEFCDAEQIYVYDINDARLDILKNKYGIETKKDVQPLIDEVDIVIFAVKPHILRDVLPDLENLNNKAAISIAAGVTFTEIIDLLPASSKQLELLRIMPNTPHMVGQGVAAFALPHSLSEGTYAYISELFKTIGLVVAVEERLIGAVTGISGCGPAYVYMMIDALADGGVLKGLPRQTARELAAQTILGGAQMVLDTKQHPGELKDNVCSPGGATIVGVAELEKNGFRNALLSAVDKASDKANEL